MFPRPLGDPSVLFAPTTERWNRLRLQITHCSGLAKTDRFRLFNPFCVVKWRGGEEKVMRTPTIYNTVHPVWNACYFEMSLGSLEEAVDGTGCYSRHRSESGGTNDRFRWRFTKGDIGRGQDSALTLLIEVCDEVEGAGTGFLGQLEIGAEGLLKMAKGRQTLVSYTYLRSSFVIDECIWTINRNASYTTY